MLTNILYKTLAEVLNLKSWTANRLKKIDLLRVRDVLLHLPYSYFEKKIEPDFNTLVSNMHIVTTVSIIKSPVCAFGRRPKIYKFEAINSFKQKLSIIFFQLPKIIAVHFKQGRKLTLQGKVNTIGGNLEMLHPEIVFNKELINKIQPIYHLTQGINNNQIHQYILNCLNLMPEFGSWHNLAVNMPSISESLINLHNPKNLSVVSQAHYNIYLRRLALEEILVNQFCLSKMRSLSKVARAPISAIAYKYHQQVFTNLGFKPTDDQQAVLNEIYSDQQSNSRMVRMLQGDVGSGKTFVALLSILNIIASNKQSCLMSPTDLLTVQHYNFFSKALVNLEIKIELLTSKIKGKKRQEVLKDLKEGKVDIIIGTHSLIQDNIEFNNLGYIVIDEQHKFGVNQRAALLNKQPNSDLLLMSATPIPRSLSMVLYGDMDISYIITKPKSNLPIITSLLSSNRIDKLIDSLQKIFNQNQQVYWICPLIQESEKKSFTSAILRFEALQKIYGIKVGLLHGDLHQNEKDRIMCDFKDNKFQLLVSTTVIEVGIDVPNATLIVIEDAQNFGLAQLHQLRGRVGRGPLQSYCILLYKENALNNSTKERLEVMTKTLDGFAIAEKDLEIRGGGDIAGTRQSGQKNFTFIDLIAHKDLLKKAQEFIVNNPKSVPDRNTISLFAEQFFVDDIGLI